MKKQLSLTMALALGSITGSAFAQTPTADQDKQFVTQASLGDFTEMHFSQLALQKSTNPKVKLYAQKMINDHQKLEADMKPVADKLGVSPATALDSDHQQKYDALSQMSGADFDKEYMTDMSADHQKTLDAFKSELSSTQDPQLKPIVQKGEKVVAQHTSMATKLQANLSGAKATGM